MIEKDVLGYKTCREMAGLTQEDAALLLPCGVRTLQDYENNPNRTVPDDIVNKMCTVYRAPLLAWWHAKYRTAYGHHFPDIQFPQSHVDMGFQVVLANDGTADVTVRMKQLLADGQISENEKPELSDCITQMKTISSRIISATSFAESLIE